MKAAILSGAWTFGISGLLVCIFALVKPKLSRLHKAWLWRSGRIHFTAHNWRSDL